MRRPLSLGLPLWAALCGGSCGEAPLTLDPSGLVSQDLGTHDIDVKGLSDEIALASPPGAVSLTLIGAAPDAGEILLRVLDPTGHALTDDLDRCTALSAEIRTYPGAGATAALLPNDDHHEFLAGTYRVRLRAYDVPTSCGPMPMAAVGPVSLRALWKTVPVGPAGQPGPLRGQRLALNVFLLGHVKRTRLLAPALERVRALYRRAGIEVDPPAIVEVPDPEGRFLRVDLDATDRALRAALAQGVGAGGGAGRAARGLDLVFVPEITAGPGYIIFGVAAGIPGTPERGSERGGVLVSSLVLDPVLYDAEFGGNVMAHETGHFLGLFHSTEADGTHGDPIDDTPGCPNFKDSDGSGLVDRRECLDYDGNNLMFWEGQSFTGKETSASGSLSPGQRRVILRSAATR